MDSPVTSSVSGIKDVALRLFWTTVAAAGSSLTGAVVLDMNAGKVAALAGITAGISFITLFARSQLPTP